MKIIDEAFGKGRKLSVQLSFADEISEADKARVEMDMRKELFDQLIHYVYILKTYSLELRREELKNSRGFRVIGYELVIELKGR
jgi:hypothetical protein